MGLILLTCSLSIALLWSSRVWSAGPATFKKSCSKVTGPHCNKYSKCKTNLSLFTSLFIIISELYTKHVDHPFIIYQSDRLVCSYIAMLQFYGHNVIILCVKVFVFMGRAIQLHNPTSRVCYSGNICSPNENIFVYTYSYTCQWDMALLFASKLNLCNILWPLFVY